MVKHPLVEEVVNGKNGCDFRQISASAVSSVQEVWNGAGLPVVSMNDIRLPLKVAQELKSPTRE